MMFPFSLRDRVKKWLNTLNRTGRGIVDWDTLVKAFYEEYFSAEKTALLRSQITSFRQLSDETLFEAWEKYNSLLNSCPHHCLEDSLLYTQFYHSLNPESKQALDSALASGIFGDIEVSQARDTIDRMARHSHVNRSGKSSVKGKHHEDSSTLLEANLSAQITQLNQKLDALSVKNASSSSFERVNPVNTSSFISGICDVCGSFGHLTQNCRSPVEQFHTFQSYKTNQYSSNSYNEGMRNHPNFSYRSNNVQSPTPPLPQPSYQPPPYISPPFRQQQQQPQNNDMAELKAMLQQSLAAQAKQELKSQSLCRIKRFSILKLRS
ncbi:hypothetical protein vseg_000746 [Gypsophila vaccaria]